MGLLVSGGGQAGFDRGFLSEPESRCGSSQTVLAQSREESTCAHQDHSGCLCSIASSGARDAGRWRTSVSRQGSIQPVLKQSGGAGPPASEATDSSDGGSEEFRGGGGDHPRNRVGREDPEAAVQDR